MATTELNVKITLENGQYVSASNQVVKATDKMQGEAKKSFGKMEKHATTSATKIRGALSRMFGLGAAGEVAQAHG